MCEGEEKCKRGAALIFITRFFVLLQANIGTQVSLLRHPAANLPQVRHLRTKQRANLPQVRHLRTKAKRGITVSYIEDV